MYTSYFQSVCREWFTGVVWEFGGGAIGGVTPPHSIVCPVNCQKNGLQILASCQCIEKWERLNIESVYPASLQMQSGACHSSVIRSQNHNPAAKTKRYTLSEKQEQKQTHTHTYTPSTTNHIHPVGMPIWQTRPWAGTWGAIQGKYTSNHISPGIFPPTSDWTGTQQRQIKRKPLHNWSPIQNSLICNTFHEVPQCSTILRV